MQEETYREHRIRTYTLPLHQNLTNMPGNIKLSPVMREIVPQAEQIFRDQYVMEFIGGKFVNIIIICYICTRYYKNEQFMSFNTIR